LKDDVLKNAMVHLACTDEFGQIVGKLVSLKDREPILQPDGLLTNPSKCEILYFFYFYNFVFSPRDFLLYPKRESAKYSL